MALLYYKLRAFLVTWLLRLLPRNAPIVFKGPDSSLALCEQISVLGFKKVLIVTDEFLGSSGLLDEIKQTLLEQGVQCTLYDRIQPDPTFDKVEEGEKQFSSDQCDSIIAVGGGSVIDAAKMIALLHTNPGELASFDGIQKAKHPAVPLFIVPTTAGTGSEISLGAVISDPRSHRKVVVVDSKLLPEALALDAKIMQGMPPNVTAATGMDALTHAIESYLATSSTPSTERQASTAVRLIFANLERAHASGNDLEARDAMALAAFYAGSAMTKTSLGYVHAIAHQLGRVSSVPHGNANAMVLPEVLEAYGECIHPRLAELACVIGVAREEDSPTQQAKSFIQAVYTLRANLQLPVKPQVFEPEELDRVVKDAIAEAGQLYPVPRYLVKLEVETLVRNKMAA